MKKCKCCLKPISILDGDYCDECYKRLSLHKKFVEDLKKEHFFQSCATNRSFGNFVEYKLRGSQNRCFALPNFSYGKITLNNNIMFNLNRGLPAGCNSTEVRRINKSYLNDKNLEGRYKND